jgi:hypothetical protein
MSRRKFILRKKRKIYFLLFLRSFDTRLSGEEFIEFLEKAVKESQKRSSSSSSGDDDSMIVNVRFIGDGDRGFIEVKNDDDVDKILNLDGKVIISESSSSSSDGDDDQHPILKLVDENHSSDDDHYSLRESGSSSTANTRKRPAVEPAMAGSSAAAFGGVFIRFARSVPMKDHRHQTAAPRKDLPR